MLLLMMMTLMSLLLLLTFDRVMDALARMRDGATTTNDALLARVRRRRGRWTTLAFTASVPRASMVGGVWCGVVWCGVAE